MDGRKDSKGRQYIQLTALDLKTYLHFFLSCYSFACLIFLFGCLISSDVFTMKYGVRACYEANHFYIVFVLRLYLHCI